MPDTTSLELPVGSQHKEVPQWLIVVGAVAGIVGVVLLVKNQGQGTVAAGSSINASLGSLAQQQQQIESDISMSSAQQAGALANMSNATNALGTNVSNLQSGQLQQQQENFLNYASTQFGYNRNAGGQAGYLVLPSTQSDYENFLNNPSLANPQYQQSLLGQRGYVFDSSGTEAHLGSAFTGTF